MKVLTKTQEHPVYQNKLLIKDECLQPLTAIEAVLKTSGFYEAFPYPKGIYARHRFRPVILDKSDKDYWIREYHTGKKDDTWVSYDYLVENIEVVRSKRSMILDEYSVVCPDTTMLTLLPVMPIRAAMLLEEVLKDLVYRTRMWNDHPPYPFDTAIATYLERFIKDVPEETMDKLVGAISSAAGGMIFDSINSIRHHKWDMLEVDMVESLLLVFNQGDYRVNEWMNQNNRRDY